METRIKYRILLPFLIVLALLLFFFGRRSSYQPGLLFEVERLQVKLQEKDDELGELRDQYHVERTARLNQPLNIAPQKREESVPSVHRRRPFTGHKLVHLDLKGAAPKMTYLLKLLKVFKMWGASGLLVEYEDMFPYDGDISVLKCHYAYSVEEMNKFLKEVKKQELLIVPLVQTFGHMEFVLKHKKFANLRHVANMTTAIHPNKQGSLPLVKMILEQIIKMHKPYIKYLHIGGDEVWSLTSCRECEPASKVYLRHIIPVVEYVRSSQLTPIVWDDMMRKWDVKDLTKIASKGVELMVWAYPASLSSHFPPGMWQRYGKSFRKIWIASAFKGADTPSSNFVPIQDRIENQKSWLNIYSNTLKEQHVDVLGIALTGWSRYDHHAALCELLPAGLPSLALCLAVLEEGDLSDEILRRVSSKLGFNSTIVLNSRKIPRVITSGDEGAFLGHTVYGIVLRLRRASNALQSVEARLPAWFSRRQVIKKTFSVYQLTVSFQRIESVLRILTEVKEMAKIKLRAFYNDDMIEEWLWDKINNNVNRALEIKKYLMDVNRS